MKHFKKSIISERSVQEIGGDIMYLSLTFYSNIREVPSIMENISGV